MCVSACMCGRVFVCLHACACAHSCVVLPGGGRFSLMYVMSLLNSIRLMHSPLSKWHSNALMVLARLSQAASSFFQSVPNLIGVLANLFQLPSICSNAVPLKSGMITGINLLPALVRASKVFFPWLNILLQVCSPKFGVNIRIVHFESLIHDDISVSKSFDSTRFFSIFCLRISNFCLSFCTNCILFRLSYALAPAYVTTE